MRLPKGTQRAGLDLRDTGTPAAALLNLAGVRPRTGLLARLPKAVRSGRRGLHARLLLRAVRVLT